MMMMRTDDDDEESGRMNTPLSTPIFMIAR